MISRYKLTPYRDKSRLPLKRWILELPPSISPTGKRKRIVFASLKKAWETAHHYRREYAKHGLRYGRLTDGRVEDCLTAYRLLHAAGLSDSILLAAVRQYIAGHKANLQSRTLAELFEAYVADAAHQKFTHGHRLRIGQTRNLFKAYADELASNLKFEEVSKVLDGPKFRNKPTSRNLHIRILKAVLAYGVLHKCARENVASRLSVTPRAKVTPEILTPEVVEKMLRHAEANDFDLLPVLLLSLYAGIRLDELPRMDWHEVRFADKQVVVLESVSKTKTFREIPLTDNALEWLRPFNGRTGKIVHYSKEVLLRARRANYRAAVGDEKVDLPQNAMRHSYASYTHELLRNANETALRLGHTDTEISYRHYIAGSANQAMTKYFNIYPSSAQICIDALDRSTAHQS